MSVVEEISVQRPEGEMRGEEEWVGLRRRGGREKKRSKVREPSRIRATDKERSKQNVREGDRDRRELRNFRRAYGPGWCCLMG